MNFIRRLGLYLIGFSIGSVFAVFIFKKKGAEFCYLPNCRVLKKLRSQALVISDSVRMQLMNNDSIAEAEIKNMFLHGDVDFSKSHPDKEPCKDYVLNNETYSLSVKWCDSLVYAVNISKRQ